MFKRSRQRSRRDLQRIAKLEGMQDQLERAAAAAAAAPAASATTGDKGHQEYQMSDGGDQSEAEWSESHELDDQRNEETGGAKGMQQWQAKGHGRWCKDGVGAKGRPGEGGGANGPATTAQPATPIVEKPCDPPTSTPAPALAGTLGTTNAGGAAAASNPSAPQHDDGRDDLQQPNKFRKGQDPSDTAAAQAAAQDTARALRLMQSQRAAAAAGEYGSQAAIQAAGEIHARNVAQVVNCALAQGVQPITTAGEELIMLGPQELEEWATANLSAGQGLGW